MIHVYESINKLVNFAIKNLGLKEKNVDYVTNSIYAMFNLDSNTYEFNHNESNESIADLLNEFCQRAIACELFDEGDAPYYKDQIAGYLSLMPAEIDEKFNEIKKENSAKATEWFYDYCVNNDYVKKAVLDKNPRFDSNGLVITINKAKPEFRDPKKAQAGNSVKGGYPKCTICHENEGFAGRSKKNLRTVDLNLNNEKWFWQFSPYGYFYQHGIAVNYKHTPMHVDYETFYRLMDFVDQYPHYFIGSNAALPRIGGSVLAHDHYQGGGEILPMQKAQTLYTLINPKYNDAVVEIIDWPGTVVRVVSKNRDTVAEISESIREKWVNYENLELGIIANDSEGIHSAVSPTAIKTERGYEMTIIFRNNITTDEYPDGVFHAHPEFHIIKKESIGLIEAQGLFILPGRLETELAEIEAIISNNQELEANSPFKMVYDECKALCNGNYEANNVHQAMQNELGSICYRILENTAVFKNKELLIKFMNDLSFN